jgi:hypothetical protein
MKKTAMRFETVPKKAIHLGTRYRIDEGDINELAASIEEVGLLQPIALDQHYYLICGYRRARAWFEILHRADPIPAVILDLDSLLLGEFTENEMRKNFTKSERIAIGKALECEAGERRGRPAKGKQTDSIDLKIRENFPEFPGKETPRTRDLAAKVAGFNNPKTYEQAKRVVDKGIPELTKAMDTGKVSVSTAAKIATKAPEEQKRVLAMPKDEQRIALARAEEIRAEKERREDVNVFINFERAIILIADFIVPGPQVWEGIARHYIPNFPDRLEQAISCLLRIREANPNAPRGHRPETIAKRS